MWAVFERIPRTLGGFLAWFGGARGIDFAGFALGQVWVLDKKVHCRSLSSIHILNNHDLVQGLAMHTALWLVLYSTSRQALQNVQNAPRVHRAGATCSDDGSETWAAHTGACCVPPITQSNADGPSCPLQVPFQVSVLRDPYSRI